MPKNHSAVRLWLHFFFRFFLSIFLRFFFSSSLLLHSFGLCHSLLVMCHFVKFVYTRSPLARTLTLQKKNSHTILRSTCATSIFDLFIQCEYKALRMCLNRRVIEMAQMARARCRISEPSSCREIGRRRYNYVRNKEWARHSPRIAATVSWARDS